MTIFLVAPDPVARIKTILDRHVAAGKLTRDEADRLMRLVHAAAKPR